VQSKIFFMHRREGQSRAQKKAQSKIFFMHRREGQSRAQQRVQSKLPGVDGHASFPKVHNL
jgi:hypothetical protein